MQAENLKVETITEYKMSDGKIYVKAGHIGKYFSIGRTTVWRLLNEMRAIPAYKESFINISYGLRLVNLEDFRKFLLNHSDRYLKKEVKP